MKSLFFIVMCLVIVEVKTQFSSVTKTKTINICTAYITNFLNVTQWTTLFNQIVDQDLYNQVAFSQQGSTIVPRILAVLNSQQTSKVAALALQMTSQLGATAFPNLLVQIEDVGSNNLHPVYNQLIASVQNLTADGHTQNGTLENIYREINSFLTFQRANTIAWRFRGVFTDAQWAYVGSDLHPFLNTAQYGL